MTGEVNIDRFNKMLCNAGKGFVLAFICTTTPNTAADQVSPLMASALPDGSSLVSTKTRPDTPRKLLKNGPRNMTQDLKNSPYLNAIKHVRLARANIGVHRVLYLRVGD